MSEKNTKTEAPATEAPAGEKRVRIRLFKDNGKYKDDVFVGVNGKGYRIQRGVDVEVPESVANVLEESARQDAATAALIERETAAGKKAINEMA